MTAAQEPRAGEVLTAESVKLLRAGDLLIHNGETVKFERVNRGGELLQVETPRGWANLQVDQFTFLSRPSESSASVGGMKDGDASDAEMGRACRKWDVGTPERLAEVMLERTERRTQAPATAPSDVDGAEERVRDMVADLEDEPSLPLMVSASVCAEHAADLRTLLTALTEAREQARPATMPPREEVEKVVRVACMDYGALPGRGHHMHRRTIVGKAADAILALAARTGGA